MITVENKLKSFSESIIKRVQEDSEQKLGAFSENNHEQLEKERVNVLREAEAIIEQIKVKAETEKQQIISKANIEREYTLLMKKKDIFERIVKEIKGMAHEFAASPRYGGFLESCIDKGLSRIKGREATLLFKSSDIEGHRNRIAGFINRKYAGTIDIHIAAADEDIIGGCIVQNKENTLRIDCSLSRLISDNEELIGKSLMDSLQQGR